MSQEQLYHGFQTSNDAGPISLKEMTLLAQTDNSQLNYQDSPRQQLVVEANGGASKLKQRKGRRRITRSSSRSTSAKNRFLRDHFELLPPNERLNVQAQIYSYGNLVNENIVYYSNKHFQRSLQKFKNRLSPTERANIDGIWDSSRGEQLLKMYY